MQHTRNNHQLPRCLQRNASSRSTSLQSTTGHEPPAQALSAVHQFPCNAHLGFPYALRAQHGDQSRALHVSDYSPISTLPPAIHIDPLVSVDIQAPVREPFPVQAYANVDPFQLGSIPDPNGSSVSYQQPQYLTPRVQPASSSAHNLHRWTPSVTASYSSNGSQLNDPMETNHVPSDYPRGYYTGNTIQSSIMPTFDQRVLHSRMTHLADNYPPMPFPPLPTYPPVDFQPRAQHENMTMEDFRQEPSSNSLDGLYSTAQSTPVANTHSSTISPELSLPPAFSAHQAKEPQNGLPNGTQRTSLLCRICRAGPFKRTHERNRHENSVHVQPRWQCELCEHRFSRKDIMERHKKRHALGVERR